MGSPCFEKQVILHQLTYNGCLNKQVIFNFSRIGETSVQASCQQFHNIKS